MSQTIEYQVKIDAANSAKTLGQLENALSDINEELKKVEPGSQTFKDLSKSAQQTNQQIQKINRELEGFTADKKFQAADGAIKIAAGSLQTFVGGLGLLGVESEALGEFEKKAASAIAVGIGLKDLSEGVGKLAPAFKLAGTSATQFGKATKVALISTGIGAFIVAVGTIAAYWDDITEAISGVSRQQKDLLATQEDSLETSQNQYDILTENENVLKLQGKSEREIRQLKIDQLTITAETLRAQLKTQEEIKTAQIETAERNKTIAQNIIRLVTLPITIALKGVDMLSAKLADLGLLDDKFVTNLEESFSGGIAGFIFNPEKVEEEADASIEETEKQLRKTENLIAGFRLQNQTEDEKVRQDDIKKAQDKEDKILAIIEEYKRKQQDLEDKSNVEKVNREEARALEELQKLGENEKAKQAIRDFYAQKRIEAEEADRILREQKEKEAADKARQALLDTIDAEYNAAMDKIEIRAMVVDAISQIANEETAIGKAAFIAQQIIRLQSLKATATAALSEMIVDEAKAKASIGKGFAETAKAGIPKNIPLLIAYGAQAAAIIGSTVRAFRSAKDTITSTTGVGGGSAATSTITPPNFATAQTPTIEQLAAETTVASSQQTQTIEAYVISGNVTSAQEAESKLKQRRRVGR
jgi:hypothetical protein